MELIENMPLYLILGLIVLALVILLPRGLFGETGMIDNARENITGHLTISYAPTGSESGKDPNVELERPIQMAGGTYVYTIKITPRLTVNGKGEADVRALISFKDAGAWATDESTGPERETFHAKADEIAQPILTAKITAPVPPIREASGAEYPHGHPIIIKSRTGSPIIVTAYLSSAREWSPPFDEVCRVKFELECASEVKYSGYMKGGEGPDGRQEIELCGGVADIKLLDKPDCVLERAEADISYDGERDFDAAETVGMSFWRDSDCVKNNAADFRQLLVLCADDRLGGVIPLKTWYISE